MEKDRQKQLILNENVWRGAFQLSWPAVLAMVLYGLNTVFDAFFVGRYVGETALAGVSLAYPLTQISLGLGSLIGVGAGSALSIAIGNKDKKTQEKLLGNVNYLNVVVSLGFMVIGLGLTQPLVKMMGGQGAALGYGVAYFRLTVFGAIFWISGLSGNMIVRAEGKMKAAAVMMAAGLFVNIICNYVFIVSLSMGVRGAALGTNIGMIVYTLVAYVYFNGKQTTFEARPFTFKRDKETVKAILSMGMPSLIMSVMSLLQAIVVLNAISRYGTTADLAFYGVSFRIFTLMLTPIFGLMRALQPMVGINYGAGNYLRVIKSFKVFALLSSLIMLPFWGLLMAFPEAALQVMMPGAVFTSLDLFNFRMFMALLPVLPVIFMAMTFYPAINKGKPASIIGIARQVVFYVPVMVVMPRLFGISWVYKGAFLIDGLMIVFTYILVRGEFKILRGKSRLKETSAPERA